MCRQVIARAQPPARLAQTLTARLACVWLVVAAILSHAVLPTGSALQRSSGSAFSVTTHDVTTIPRRDRSKQRAEAGQLDDRTDLRGSGDAGAAILPAVAPLPEPGSHEGIQALAEAAERSPERLFSLHRSRAPPAPAQLIA